MRSRSYDKEFKLNAIELYKNGKGGTQICHDLGIPNSTFWGWMAEHHKNGAESFPGSGKVKPSDEENQRLKKELDDVKMERDILKKALAIFSRAR
jgi:transposase